MENALSYHQDVPMDEECVKRSILNASYADKRLYKSRIQKFRTTHILYIILLGSLALLQLIAVAFFTRGFLLTRQVIDDVLTKTEEYGKFSKAVIIVVDALRFDFVLPIEKSNVFYNENYHNNLKILSETGESSLLLKFIADPPTTTLQRLKGLTTGSLPTFIDAGSNFHGDVIEEDNIIKQMYLNNMKINFAGDDTWDALFHPFLSNESIPYESLNVWDLDTVDQGVISFFKEHLFQKSVDNRTWDILIGHMLGIDHVGHKYGPNHLAMRKKQIQIDQFIRDVIDHIQEDTLLIVMGDHGMDHTGNHGGDSDDEIESTLWLYSKKPNIWNHKTLDSYNVSCLGKSYRKVNQIDLVSTLALLLGLPVPFNNLGWPIDEISTTQEELEFHQNIVLKQLVAYRETSNISIDSNKNQMLKDLLDKAILASEFAPQYQQAFLEICKDLWARFDYYSIFTGITFLFISLILLIIIIKLIPSIVIGQMVGEFIPNIIVMSLISNVCFNGIFHVLQQPSFLNNWIWCSLFATAVGIIVGCYIPIFDRYNLGWIFLRFTGEFSDYWSRIAVLVIILHSLLFASNSFIIWEDKIVSFLLITIGVLLLYEFIFLPKHQSTSISTLNNKKRLGAPQTTFNQVNPNDLPLGQFSRILGAYYSIVLIISTRLASIITICREEQGKYCVPTFTLTNNYSIWTMLACLLLVVFIPSTIKGYYNISSSYQAAAPIWIDKFLKGVLFLNFIYWSLTGFENKMDGWTSNIDIWKFTLSRIIIGFSLIAANVGWMMGPLCIKMKTHSNHFELPQATILGYGNAYGSQLFLLVINFMMCAFLFSKPLAQISLFLMCNQLLSILEIFDLLKLKENFIGPVVMGLLSYQHFFTTGHQATIPSIQWDVGFILTKDISFPFTHFSIFMNTFSPHILCGLSVALLTLWKQPPGILKPQTILGRIVSNCGMMIIYHSVLCLSSFIWVTHFRRHLMVWKIFCPRFILAAMCLLVTQFVITFLTIAFASGRLIRQINSIFWK